MMSSAGSDGTVNIWSMPAGTLKCKLTGHTAVVVSATIVSGPGGDDSDSDGYEVLSASCDRTIRIWSIASGSCLKVLEGHRSNVSHRTRRLLLDLVRVLMLTYASS